LKKSPVVVGAKGDRLAELPVKDDDSKRLAPRPTGLNMEGLAGEGMASGLKCVVGLSVAVEERTVGGDRTGSTVSA
jgi:hypothetical protein